jgi:6-phospho-beta-glucosidase
MKLTVLGGGGFRVPLVFGAVLGDGLIDEFRLYDPDPGRLDVIGHVLRQMADKQLAGQQLAGRGRPVTVTATTRLEEALPGSDFIFSAIRVGGAAGRVADERAALGLGLLGQETTGPGGIAFALRTIPVALRIAEQVARLAPGAFVINFTNPAGIITEAMQRVLGDRVVGICDTPSNLVRRLAALTGAPDDAVRLDYVGLNHLGWLRRATYQGRDLVAGILADAERLDELEETHLFGADWLQSLAMIPNEYLYYYYNTHDAIAAINRSPQTRGEFLHEQQQRFYERVSAHPESAVTAWRKTKDERETTYMSEARGTDRGERPGTERAGAGRTSTEQADTERTAIEGGGGYEAVALRVMRAVALNQPATMILTVRNGPVLAALPPEAVIEVPTLIDAAGARPLAVEPPALAELGLMQQVKAVEQLTIASAVEGRRDLARKALALHPLVDSTGRAGELLRRYERNTPGLFTPVD